MEYYFDIETITPLGRPDPQSDRIITVSYQNISLKNGKPQPLSELKILKDWEMTEKEIVTAIYKRFFMNAESDFYFVPVGYSLNYDLELLRNKFKEHLGKDINTHGLPNIDLRQSIILINNGQFKGTKMTEWTNKKEEGKLIKELYNKKEYDKIEGYIKDEKDNFLELLQKLLECMPKLKNEILEKLR